MIQVFSTDKDKYVRITPLNPGNIYQGIFGNDSNDIVDRVSDIFPLMKKAFANKTFAKTCDQLRSDIFTTHLQNVHLDEIFWFQNIRKTQQFLREQNSEDDCLKRLFNVKPKVAAITRLDVRQARRSPEEQDTVTVSLQNGSRSKTKPDDLDIEGKKNDDTNIMKKELHFESFQLELKANHVTQNVRFSICPQLPNIDLMDCIRRLRRVPIKSEETENLRQRFTTAKYDEEDDNLLRLLDNDEDEEIEHDLGGVTMNVKSTNRRDIDQIDNIKRLWESISLGDLRLFRRIVEEFASPDFYGPEWYMRCVEPQNQDSVLHCAAQIGRNRILRYLIHNLKHVTSVRNLNGECPIHIACRTGNLDVATELLNAHDANLHVRQTQEYCPIHIASLYGHIDVVNLLLKRGASVTQHTKGGYTPLDLAIKNGHTVVAQVLKEYHQEHDTSKIVGSGGVVIGRAKDGTLLYDSL